MSRRRTVAPVPRATVVLVVLGVLLVAAATIVPVAGASFTTTSATPASAFTSRTTFSGPISWVGRDVVTSAQRVQLGTPMTTSVAAGEDFSCAVGTDGALWCWGSNASGRVGDGSPTSTSRLRPVRVGASTGWASVATGSTHACATRTDGGLWCWGANASGQLGDGSRTARSTPVEVAGGARWSAVAVGDAHTCALRRGGGLWCWGGDGTTGPATSTPTAVAPGEVWSTLDAGPESTCVVRADGSLWCWGRNARGNLGDGTTTDRDVPTQVGTATTWGVVAAGRTVTCATRTDATLWCWGDNGVGQLGDGTTTPRPAPGQVGSAAVWADVSVTEYSPCAVRTDGSLWCWGNNDFGQLGDATFQERRVPTRVAGSGWAAVTSGLRHTCARRLDTSTWCWGLGFYGQLGDGTTQSRRVPTRVGVEAAWDRLASGRGEHACARRNDRSLWCWGSGADGRLGDGTVEDRSSPTRVGTDADWRAVATGVRHTCAVRTSGTLWCWGSAAHGALGEGSTTGAVRAPVQVGTGSTWSRVAAGEDHTCATRTDGSLWCWGRGDGGRLGVGADADRAEPTRVGTGTGWSRVSAGASGHTCATRVDGTLWCWGVNDAGRLGDGTTVTRWAPVPVATDGSWADVAVGARHTCALGLDRSVWCWGAGDQGQLGSGGTSSSTTPVRVVGGPTAWEALEAGADVTCATARDGGALWCWGANADGQLADGTTTPRAVPTSAGVAPVRFAVGGRGAVLTTS